jgi:Fusaric acid resistance protein-like
MVVMTQATGEVEPRADNMAHRRLGQLIFAAVLMAAAGITLIITAIWAFSFHGLYSKDLRRALGGHSLTSVGVVSLVVGIVLIVCAAGVLVGPWVNRWVGLVSRLVGIVAAAAGAISGIWLVAYYPGWAVTYTIVGVVIVFVLTLYERELRSSWPWAPLRAYAAKVFALNTKGVNVPRGVAVAGLVLIALVVTVSLHQERYFLSVAFGVLFVGLSDQGGDYLSRLGRMAVVGLIGALVTALGYGIGGDAWGWAVLATFAVTVLAGLAIDIDLHAFVAASFLNVLLLITLASAAGLPARVSAYPWQQALAWLIGSAVWIAFTFPLWLVQGRSSRPSPLPEIPADAPPVKLSRPVVLFVLIRAVAVAGSVAIAFGLHLSSADWMPIATLIAMKPSLQQSTLRGVQRLVGATLGAAIAAVFLVTVTSHHALEEIIILLMGAGVSIYVVNYVFYAAAIAGAVLIALDLPHPSNLDAEGRRVFFTFAGIGIAVVVMFLAGLLQKGKASAAAPHADKSPAAAPHAD